MDTLREIWHAIIDVLIGWWPPSFQDLYQVFSVAVIVMACLIIPYSASALLYKEHHPAIRETHINPHRFYWPSLRYLTQLTKIFLSGMIFIMGITIMRIALQYDAVGNATPQPNWSLALSMITSMILLVLLSSPSIFLIRLKLRIMDDDEKGRKREIDGF